jgi:hypothetical protein
MHIVSDVPEDNPQLLTLQYDLLNLYNKELIIKRFMHIAIDVPVDHRQLLTLQYGLHNLYDKFLFLVIYPGILDAPVDYHMANFYS